MNESQGETFATTFCAGFLIGLAAFGALYGFAALLPYINH